MTEPRSTTSSTWRHPTRGALIAIAIAVVAVLIVAAATIAWAVGRDEPADERAGEPPRESSAEPSPRSSTSAPASCPDAGVEVADADELQAALENANPGDVIRLAPGRYTGEFTTTRDGQPDAPILLCGTADSVLDGGDIKGGYVIHLDGAAHWILQGFAVENGQKGVMADSTTGSVIRDLTVSRIGDEAIHLRAGSTDNQVLNNTISDTGLRKPKFGEGIYIGTAESNWCDISDCEPDKSDRNLIEGNRISGTTSESVDIKEGTTGGILRGNTFDGAALVEADSWVDVKGNDWLIEANTGSNAADDGFQTHEILDGWGTGNIFRGNTAGLTGSGAAFALEPELENVVECDNTVTGGDAELSNVDCRS